MSDRLAAAVFYMSQKAPYFHALIWSLPVLSKPGLGTYAVRYPPKAALLVDEKATEKWSIKERAGVLAHEMLHVTLRHNIRGRGKVRKVWRVAEEIEANTIVLGIPGLALPAGCITRELYRIPAGLSAEEIYAIMLPRQDEISDKKDFCQCEHGEGEDEGSGDQEEARIDATRNAFKDGVSQALKAGAPIPEALELALQVGRHAPKVNWQSVVKRWAVSTMMNGGKNDRSFTRLHRNSICIPDTVIPGWVSSKPKIALIVDTSGSMFDAATLARSVASCKTIIEKTGADYIMIAADTSVKSETKNINNFKAAGGGGTSFDQPIQHALKKGVKGIIYVTDGIGNCSMPGAPVFWLMVPGYKPPFENAPHGFM